MRAVTCADPPDKVDGRFGRLLAIEIDWMVCCVILLLLVVAIFVDIFATFSSLFSPERVVFACINDTVAGRR